MMQRNADRSCPYCGGTPILYKQPMVVPNPICTWMTYDYLVRCPVCGACSHYHDNEDDALNEFYAIEDLYGKVDRSA